MLLPSPLPDRHPSFSSSSCPNSPNFRCPARWSRTGGRPAPPAPPAGHGTSLQPSGRTNSAGCRRSSPPSAGQQTNPKKKGREKSCTRRCLRWKLSKSERVKSLLIKKQRGRRTLATQPDGWRRGGKRTVGNIRGKAILKSNWLPNFFSLSLWLWNKVRRNWGKWEKMTGPLYRITAH